MNQQVNLYQPIPRQREKVFSALTLAQALGVIVVALLALYGWAAWRTAGLDHRVEQLRARREHADRTLKRLEAAIAARRPSAALNQALKTAKTDRDARRALLAALASPRHASTQGFAEVLTDLARAPVPQLWLTDITLDDGGSHIRLTGATTRSARVPQLVETLADESAFAGVEFRQLKISRADPSAESPHGRAHLNFVLSTAAPEESSNHESASHPNRRAH